MKLSNQARERIEDLYLDYLPFTLLATYVAFAFILLGIVNLFS